MKTLKVLVACEFSARVRVAFEKRGWFAISCDLLPSDDIGGNHHTGDVSDLLEGGLLWDKWDLLIGFPDCRYLASSGMHWTTRGFRDPKLTDKAFEFFMKLYTQPIRHIALENSVGVVSTRFRKPNQIIQPWMFGHPESKSTCLWLKNLPKLNPTNILPLPESGRWENQTKSGQNKLGPSKTRALKRAITYQGIADAMADQWGRFIEEN